MPAWFAPWQLCWDGFLCTAMHLGSDGQPTCKAFSLYHHQKGAFEAVTLSPVECYDKSHGIRLPVLQTCILNGIHIHPNMRLSQYFPLVCLDNHPKKDCSNGHRCGHEFDRDNLKNMVDMNPHVNDVHQRSALAFIPLEGWSFSELFFSGLY